MAERLVQNPNKKRHRGLTSFFDRVKFVRTVTNLNHIESEPAMLSIHAIDRTLETKDYDRLLRDLGRNGLVMPLPLRVQLAESSVGAKGLGLRRLVELTFGPTALSKQLIAGLIRAQSPEGAALDAAGRPSCLLTAALAAGLGRVLRDHAGRNVELHGEVRAAYDRALACLASMQRDDGLFDGPQDREQKDRQLTSAFIAYLLLDSPGFASTCRGYALLSVLEEGLEASSADVQQLVEMARLTRMVPAQGPIAEITPQPQPRLLLSA